MKEAKPQLGINRAHVGVNFPYTQRVFPAIVVSLGSLNVQQSGLYAAELTDPRNQLMFSRGEVTLEVYTPNHNVLMTIVDFITQCYLMNMFERNKMAFPGLEREYIAINYQGGDIDWSAFQLAPADYTSESYKQMYTTSTSLPFFAEHHLSTNVARISALDIEAIPLNRTV